MAISAREAGSTIDAGEMMLFRLEGISVSQVDSDGDDPTGVEMSPTGDPANGLAAEMVWVSVSAGDGVLKVPIGEEVADGRSSTSDSDTGAPASARD